MSSYHHHAITIMLSDSSNMHQPGIEPTSYRWQWCILLLDHWCPCKVFEVDSACFQRHFPLLLPSTHIPQHIYFSSLIYQQTFCQFGNPNSWSQKHHGPAAKSAMFSFSSCEDFQAVLPLLLELGKLEYSARESIFRGSGDHGSHQHSLANFYSE